MKSLILLKLISFVFFFNNLNLLAQDNAIWQVGIPNGVKGKQGFFATSDDFLHFLNLIRKNMNIPSENESIERSALAVGHASQIIKIGGDFPKTLKEIIILNNVNPYIFHHGSFFFLLYYLTQDSKNYYLRNVKKFDYSPFFEYGFSFEFSFNQGQTWIFATCELMPSSDSKLIIYTRSHLDIGMVNKQNENCFVSTVFNIPTIFTVLETHLDQQAKNNLRQSCKQINSTFKKHHSYKIKQHLSKREKIDPKVEQILSFIKNTLNEKTMMKKYWEKYNKNDLIYSPVEFCDNFYLDILNDYFNIKDLDLRNTFLKRLIIWIPSQALEIFSPHILKNRDQLMLNCFLNRLKLEGVNSPQFLIELVKLTKEVNIDLLKDGPMSNVQYNY